MSASTPEGTQPPAAGVPAYTHIVVGAGSAGCVLANRLSEDPSQRVLLVEAGPPDTSPLISMPKGFGRLLADPAHARYTPVAPHPGNAHRQEVWARGQMLGGSSSINGMVYMRGHPEDYDGWQVPGWSWAEIGRCFRTIEDHALGADAHRGTGGPLAISRYPQRSELSDAVLAACGALGLARRDDLNRPDHEGVAYLSYTIRDGVRQSAARAFLSPSVRARPNLVVLTGARVTRVRFEGTRAVGVEARVAGVARRYDATREIVLSAGALESPRLLQLSGVGDAAHFRSLGIAPVAHSPEVGLNLREHLLYMAQWRLADWRDTHNRAYRGWRLALNAALYAAARRGVLALGPYPVGGFYKTRPGEPRPDAQLMMCPYTLDFAAGGIAMERVPGMQLFSYALRPRSRGVLRITSPDPDAPAHVDPNYLADAEDCRIAVASLRFMREVCATPPLASRIAEETRPGPAVRSDDEVLEAYRRGGQSGYHACGTCRMGTDASSVVDARLRVRGVQGLRVMDLSVTPTMISGNTNGPVMAMAWRAAELMKEDALQSN